MHYWVLVISFAIAAPVVADQRNYSLTVAGFPAGTVSVSDSTSTTRYSVAAKIRSSGIASLFGRTSYDGRASGRIRSGRLFPTSYEGTIKSGDKFSRVILTYRNGVPRIDVFDPRPPPSAFTIAPQSQRGTVDILSSAYWMLRERPASELCNVTYASFDGIRRAEITLGPPAHINGRFVCEGTYLRAAGFSARAIRRGRNFPMTLTYRASQNGFILEDIKAQTVFGQTRLVLIK